MEIKRVIKLMSVTSEVPKNITSLVKIYIFLTDRYIMVYPVTRDFFLLLILFFFIIINLEKCKDFPM